MRVGLILECGPFGADKQVCEYLIRTHFASVELGRCVTLTQKPNLLSECGAAAANLLDEGHDRVIVLWDLYPAWRQDGEKPCLSVDRKMVLASMAAAKVSADKIFLVCISEELEAWLLADGSALTTFLSRTTHPVPRIQDRKVPDSVQNPKTVLTMLTQKHGRPKYNDMTHAIQIIKLVDLNKLRRSASFQRFEAKVTGK
jgi:hypothetical protein